MRPLSLRRFSKARPVRVAIRPKNPWTFWRRLFFGWCVRLDITTVLYSILTLRSRLWGVILSTPVILSKVEGSMVKLRIGIRIPLFPPPMVAPACRQTGSVTLLAVLTISYLFSHLRLAQKEFLNFTNLICRSVLCLFVIKTFLARGRYFDPENWEGLLNNKWI